VFGLRVAWQGHAEGRAAWARAGVQGVKPVLVELTDFKTKQVVDTLEVDAVLVATGRAPFTQARPRAGKGARMGGRPLRCEAAAKAGAVQDGGRWTRCCRTGPRGLTAAGRELAGQAASL
jgi:hypothetical protein